ASVFVRLSWGNLPKPSKLRDQFRKVGRDGVSDMHPMSGDSSSTDGLTNNRGLAICRSDRPARKIISPSPAVASAGVVRVCMQHLSGGLRPQRPAIKPFVTMPAADALTISRQLGDDRS